jgi:hypothetical protein
MRMAEGCDYGAFWRRYARIMCKYRIYRENIAYRCERLFRACTGKQFVPLNHQAAEARLAQAIGVVFFG